MAYALIRDGVVLSFPYTADHLRIDNPNISFSSIDMDKFEELGVFAVQTANEPVYDVFTQQTNYNIVQDNGVWKQVWNILELPLQVQESNVEKKVKKYIRTLEKHLDTTAQERLYHDRISCALRAGYRGPYQEEGQAFAMWMDQIYYLGYKWTNEMQTGTRPWVSEQEFIAMFPVCTWNVQMTSGFTKYELESYEP